MNIEQAEFMIMEITYLNAKDITNDITNQNKNNYDRNNLENVSDGKGNF